MKIECFFLLILGCNPSDQSKQEISKDTAQVEVEPSLGCGVDPIDASSGVQITRDFGDSAGGDRGFFLVIPEDYDPNQRHRVVFGFPGRDWTGEPIRGYFNLEDGTPGEIFVYPDPLWREFEGWGTYGGWLLGDHAGPATGREDFEFVLGMIEYLQDNYCIDPQKIFATGHSWGGDMSHVLACFLGEQFRAAVPVAANSPYWFVDDDGNRVECSGQTAVWTMFGVADEAFPNQPYDGAYGDECSAFWHEENGCGGASVDLALGSEGECVEYLDCQQTTRYCLYGSEYGHQIPTAYYAAETMTFFRQFE